MVQGIDEDSLTKLDSAESLDGIEQFIQAASSELEGFAEIERHRVDLDEASRILNISMKRSNFDIDHLRDALNVGLELAGSGHLASTDEEGRVRASRDVRWVGEYARHVASCPRARPEFLGVARPSAAARRLRSAEHDDLGPGSSSPEPSLRSASP